MLCACMYKRFLAIHVSTIFTTTIILPLQYQSCITSVLHESCAQDKCVLQRRPGSKSNVYSCCCQSNVCNTKLIYPDLNATSPLLSRTAATADTTSTDGDVSMDTTSSGLCESLCVGIHWCVCVCVCVYNVFSFTIT